MFLTKCIQISCECGMDKENIYYLLIQPYSRCLAHSSSLQLCFPFLQLLIDLSCYLLVAVQDPSLVNTSIVIYITLLSSLGSWFKLLYLTGSVRMANKFPHQLGKVPHWLRQRKIDIIQVRTIIFIGMKLFNFTNRKFYMKISYM